MDVTKTYVDFGLTVLIALAAIFLAIKYVPKWLDLQISKQKKYDAMMETVITIAQQGNAIIERNNILLNKNSEVIERNTQAYEKIENCVNVAMGGVGEKLECVEDVLDDHIKQATKINSHLEILLDRTKRGVKE